MKTNIRLDWNNIIAAVIVIAMIGMLIFALIANAYATSSVQSYSFTALPVVNSSTVSTGGAIIATDTLNSIIRAGSNSTNTFIAYSLNSVFVTLTSDSSTYIVYYDDNGNVISRANNAIIRTNNNLSYLSYWNKTGITASVNTFSTAGEATLYLIAHIFYSDDLYLASYIYPGSTSLATSGDWNASSDVGYFRFKVGDNYYILGKSSGTWVSNGSSQEVTNTIIRNGKTYYYREYGLGSQIYNFIGLTFDTFEDGIDYFSSVLYPSTPDPDPDPDPDDPSYNDGGTDLSHLTNVNFVVPAGYLAIVETDEGTTGVANTIFRKLSDIVPVGGNYWTKQSARIWNKNEMPVVGDIYTVSGIDAHNGALATWDKVDSVNGLGQTYNGICQFAIDPDTYNYKAILNPKYNFYGSNDHVNSNISITIVHPAHVWIYPMTSTFSTYNNGSAIDNLILSEPYELTVSGSWRSPAGGNTMTLETGITDGEQGTVLDNLVSDIDQFFTGSWSHISQLKEKASQFSLFMKDLFSWLPSDVTVIIVSFISIFCVVGIIKALV